MQTANSGRITRVHPGVPVGNKLTLGQTVDQQILQTVTANHGERTVRTKFLQMALDAKGAIGVCFLKRGIHEQWAPAIDSPSVGRLPPRATFDETFSEKCDTFATSPNVQLGALPSMKAHAAFAPIRPRGSQSEILLIVTTSQAEAVAISSTLQRIASSLQLWLNGQHAADSDWQVVALASVIEMVGKIEQHASVKPACEETVNLLANRIGCDSVAIGLIERGRMRLHAISGVAKVDHGSTSSQNYLQTLVESATRNEPAVYPAKQQQNNHMLQAHKQLAASIHAQSVYSQPLVDDNDKVVGAMILTGPKALMESSQSQRFANTAAPSIAASLASVRKMHVNPITRTTRYVRRKTSAMRRMVILVVCVALVALMFLPITYRVRCYCVTEPTTRRYAVAPFQGQITVGHKEAGDFVDKGDLLAEMDGRTIRWELSGVSAQREQSLRTREMELSERNIPKTILAELEYDRLVSEEAVLEYKRDHLQIKSPVQGVVLSGSLERAEAAAVETGQVLFEIGPLKPMRVEIAIPDDEISQVSVGFPVKVWIDGQEDEPIEGKIKKIHPRSETRDADNVFIAEIECPNEDERLRPGMKGSARIDGEERRLAWALFHKPVNYVRSRLTWW